MSLTFLTRFVFVGQAAAEPSPWLTFVPMLLILAVAYFLLIRPVRKRQQELQAMVEALRKGDRVITNGGLHGEVAGIEGGVVYLRIADNVKVKVSKSAISDVEDKAE